MIGVDIKKQTIDHKTAIDLALEMERSSVLDVFELFITSDPRYSDMQEMFEQITK